jgi:hypothetical protein
LEGVQLKEGNLLIFGILGILVLVIAASGCTSTSSDYLTPIPANETSNYKASAQTIPLATY